ncbi:uncharacterized protein [Amphiura filiformis]|uniref:uncharacterized protein isoform X2 n=1 Tax=Amphiura filiformis TaxID=82378 RepID=UPI003B227F2B
MAPELFQDDILSPTYDIHAYGVVVWELWTTDIPFEDCKIPANLIWRICQNKERPKIPLNCPKTIRDLMTKCWEPNWKMRPTMTQVMLMLTTAEAEASQMSTAETEASQMSTAETEASQMSTAEAEASQMSTADSEASQMTTADSEANGQQHFTVDPNEKEFESYEAGRSKISENEIIQESNLVKLTDRDDMKVQREKRGWEEAFGHQGHESYKGGMLPSDREILDMANEVNPRDMKRLYVYLGLSEDTIEAAEFSVEGDNVWGKSVAVLLEWRKQNGPKATKEVLLEALDNCGNRESMDTLRQKWGC